MDLKELEKEAEEYLHKDGTEAEKLVKDLEVLYLTKKQLNGFFAIFKQIYIDSAEPREKRIADLEAQIEKMKNWCNCKNYSQCLIELAEQGKGMKPSECCVNCKKWELEDYKTRLERRNKKKQEIKEK